MTKFKCEIKRYQLEQKSKPVLLPKRGGEEMFRSNGIYSIVFIHNHKQFTDGPDCPKEKWYVYMEITHKVYNLCLFGQNIT